MPDPIYFQWQNEYLLRTIYPLRELKLRDFLLFFHEIDVWQQYKNKPIQSLSGEVQAYRAAQKTKILQAYDVYQKTEAYVLTEDVAAQFQPRFPTLDDSVMKQINEVHKSFKRYFPNYKNAVREKYFAAERVRQMEALLKRILFQISEKERIMRNNGPAWVGRAAYEKEKQRLETVSRKMVEQELSQLVAFLGAYERLYQFKQDALKQKAARERELQDSTRKVQLLRNDLESQQTKLGAIQAAINRMKNPPRLEALKAYFLDDDVSDVYRQRVGTPDPAVLRLINEAHRAFKTFFPTYNNAAKEKYFIGQRLGDLDRMRKLKQQELVTATRMGNTASMAALKKTLQMLDEEVGKLSDFQWAYENQGKAPGSFSGQIAQAEKDQSGIQAKIRAVQEDIAAQEKIINQVKAFMSTAEKDLLLTLIDAAPVTVNDLARERVEEYKAELVKKDLKQLMEAVVAEFMRNPTRYPLWLQYMVIHFSGMRYQSAHGSWADPRDMLLSLRMRAIEQNLRRTGEDAIRVMSEERYMIYKSGGIAPNPDGGAQITVPALAAAKDPYWTRRIEHHIKALDPNSWYSKYRALLDVQIDEEDYEIQQLTDAQALSALEDMKDEIPDWMWKEIVRCTNLRLTQVKQENWEQLTPEEIEQRYAAGMGPFRDILIKWKSQHLTGWREEHDRTSQLIVTRAVCNEVAEHIQHIRGRTPPGGLTAKPEWYLRNEKDPRLARVPDKPYFTKPKAPADFRPGASLFWLHWVNKQPNIWQIARPFTLRNGEELIPVLKDAQNEISNTGSAFLRRVTFKEKAPNGKFIERQSQQWLRWNHEATVVEVTETADGPTVLTFETALPGEDRRQSTIGVFKRYAADLRYNVSASLMIGTFVGYIPEGAVPYDQLRDMLDWNHILLRSAYTPAEIEQYWRKVKKPIDPSIAFAAQVQAPETQVEVAPRVAHPTFSELAACYEVSLKPRGITLYQPPADLQRGARLLVTKDLAERFDGAAYYPITRCDYEPRAEGLYVRADEVLDAPEENSLRKAKARKHAALYRICYADEALNPIFDESSIHIAAGTKFLVSTVHRAGPRDKGDGAVLGRGRQGYYLIVACPEMPEAEGLFIKRSEQRRL